MYCNKQNKGFEKFINGETDFLNASHEEAGEVDQLKKQELTIRNLKLHMMVYLLL